MKIKKTSPDIQKFQACIGVVKKSWSPVKPVLKFPVINWLLVAQLSKKALPFIMLQQGYPIESVSRTQCVITTNIMKESKEETK